MFDGNHLFARKPVWIATAAALVALQIALTLTHRPWVDEWQALQIALQSPDWSALLANLHYEGHPPLWYAILRGAALFVPPLLVLTVVQVVIAICTQVLILFRLPLSRLERLLIGSGYFILIEYGTVSRSISLGALIVIAFFTLRAVPVRWAMIALMPLVDFQFGLVSLIALALMAHENRWSWTGSTLWFACALFAAYSVLPAPDFVPALEAEGGIGDIVKILHNHSALLIPLHFAGGEWTWWGALPPPLLDTMAGGFFLIFALRHVLADRWNRALMAAFIAANIAFYLLVYPLAVRHLTLIALLLILLKARERADGLVFQEKAFRLWLIVGTLCGLIGIGISFTRPFNTAHHAAAYIASHGLRDKNWISLPESQGQGVAAMLGIEMLTPGKGCTQSFIRWDYRNRVVNEVVLKRDLDSITARYGRVYLLSQFTIDAKKTGGILYPLAHFAAGYDGYSYHLYVVRPDLPEARKSFPQCPPGRVSLRISPRH